MTISAKVIADSIGVDSPRLTTLQLRYPKFIHGEFMTHRVFSRNASSSRAIPVERLIKDVIDDPFYPSFWGKNQPGMSAMEEHQGLVFFPQVHSAVTAVTRERAWDIARTEAISMATAFSAAGYHKQIVNRLLEPFCHINVVVTATEWSNFFALRLHRDAQPEIRILAEAMRDAMARNTPTTLEPGEWHLPYVFKVELDDLRIKFVDIEEKLDDEPTMVQRVERGLQKALDYSIRLSVARCARVSYLTQEGKTPSVEEDLKLYERLAGSVPLHASPMEHQATPDKQFSHQRGWQQPELHGNLRGWVQYRKTLAGENQ